MSKLAALPQDDPIIIGHVADALRILGGTACAEKDMAKRLGAGLLDLPSDWYDNTPDRGPQ